MSRVSEVELLTESTEVPWKTRNVKLLKLVFVVHKGCTLCPRRGVSMTSDIPYGTALNSLRTLR